jgi:uncharacterized coiled-coil DUF342 family protein
MIMPRKGSDATELRETKRALRIWQRDCDEVRAERNRLADRLRATYAELAEWKARFDELLKRVPEVKP